MNQSSRQLPARRRAGFVQHLTESGQATVAELAEVFDVSLDTVRRDLDLLANEGALTRTHGGAIPADQVATADQPFGNRVTTHSESKTRIGASAARLIGDGETVLINGGTTTLAVARALVGKRDLTLVTNNLRVPTEVPEEAVRDLYLIGGSYRASAMVTLGPVQFPGTGGISADVAIIGVGGISPGGVSTSTLSEAQMMREMIDSAGRVLVVADGSKFGRNAFAQIAELTNATTLVTDVTPPEALASALQHAGVRSVVD